MNLKNLSLSLHYRFQLITCFFKNILQPTEISYIVEPADWSIRWDGEYITANLNRLGSVGSAKMSICEFAARSKLIHYGSRNIFFQSKRSAPKKRKILTWFHIIKNDPYLSRISNLSSEIDLLHTSTSITASELINAGFPDDRCVIVPLGVDTFRFCVPSLKEKTEIRKKLGIPMDRLCIGSFQKDGEGWDDGNTPKLVKGPDVFCDVMEVLAQKYPLHVLLTGPARGYVKQRLQKKQIPYSHYFLGDYHEIPFYYKALDLYLISSRAEGGPKSLIEGMATGIPVVSTRVGMAVDIIQQGINGFMVASDNDPVADLVDLCTDVIDHPPENYAKTARAAALEFDWEIITQQYIDHIYKKLL